MAYIDPITGAYVDDSLDALPPGYNQPKAGNEANVAKMRAALNNGWDNNEPLPDLTPPKTDPFSLIKHAYQNMPGAGVAQGVMPALLSMPQFLASLGYGIGNQAVNHQTANFDRDTTRAMQAMQYTPPTQAGRDISDFIGKVGEATGPLPELWNTRIRFTPDELAVAGRTATEDFRNFGSDYANAKNGVQREYPTTGSRAAQFTDVAGDMVRPMAEKAYDMYMNPKDAEFPSVNPISNLGGLAPSVGPMYAVKPKGGNWPTNLGSTNRLSEQGEFGMHLADSQITDPATKWWEHLPRGVKWDWDKFLQEKTVEHGGSITPQQKQAYAEEFTKIINSKREVADETPITLPSQYESVAPQFNSWVMGPYQKYITNQMGTGLSSDPLVQAFNETDMPVNEVSKMLEAPDYQAKHDADWADMRRRDYMRKLTDHGTNSFDLKAPQNADIGSRTATSPAGIAIENALDSALAPKRKNNFSTELGYLYSDKLPNDAVINDFNSNSPYETTALPSIQKKVLNDLIAGNLDINKLSNLTPAVVARELIKDELEKQKALQSNKAAAESYRVARNKQLPVDLNYDDGSKMVIFTKADYDKDPLMLTRDLSQITKDLHQCIGSGCHGTDEYPRHGPVLEPHTGKPPKGSNGTFRYASYFEGLQKGTREIASLKDPNGISQFTANITVRKPELQGYSDNHKSFIRNWVYNKTISNPEERNRWEQVLSNLNLREAGVRQSIFDDLPGLEEAFNKHFLQEAEKSITEMKGYDNQEIEPKYLPHVKEWLNQHFDLDHVNMDKLEGEIFDLKNIHSANNLLESKHQNWSSVAIEQLLLDTRDNNLLPRFFDDKDFEALAQHKGVDLTEDPSYKEASFINGQITEEEKTKRQQYYETVSRELRNTFTDTYLQDAFAGGDNAALRQLVRELEDRPTGYFLGSPSPGTRQAVINRLRNQGLHTPGRELENVAQGFEPDDNNPAFNVPAPQQFNRLTDLQTSVLDDNMQNYFAENGNHLIPEDMVEPYATDTRILMGSQEPEARLLPQSHRRLVDTLLDQYQHTVELRDLISHMQTRGAEGTGLSEAQAENALNMLISWTERYPLAE